MCRGTWWPPASTEHLKSHRSKGDEGLVAGGRRQRECGQRCPLRSHRPHVRAEGGPESERKRERPGGHAAGALAGGHHEGSSQPVTAAVSSSRPRRPPTCPPDVRRRDLHLQRTAIPLLKSVCSSTAASACSAVGTASVTSRSTTRRRCSPGRPPPSLGAHPPDATAGPVRTGGRPPVRVGAFAQSTHFRLIPKSG